MSSSGLCTYKDEVTELKDELNSAENQRNPAKYKSLIQQAILYMTKGIDTTPLFTTIVKAAAMKDLVQKKLCYLYLCHYASSHADLALLTVNTLKRDAEDTNYMVRALALRSIASLRLPSLVEYTKDVMLKGLKDHSSYVRKAAVIGCLQLYDLARQEFNREDLISQINRTLTTDKDMQVRRNCIFVMEEMRFNLAKDSSFFCNYLLDRLHRFDEWGMQFVLDVLMRHLPEKEEEEEDVYKTLNTLDVCLKHANTSVVLGAVRVFLHYTSRRAELRHDVYNRIKVPLLTALSSKSPEISYSVVCHIEVILSQCPTLFEDSVSSFYCRHNDPLYLKIKKLGVLSKLVTESNGKQILDELSYHVRHDDTASHSIHNIGMIALLHPQLADTCIEQLFSFLQSHEDFIVSHTLVALRDLVIKYDKHSALVSTVSKYLNLDLLPDGKASVVWMLGEFGENIPEAPYVLELLIDNIDKETSPIIKLELLTATMKLFFKRPPECQAMLGHLLEFCIEQEYNMDIRDRALLYYRLLEIDVNKAREVICCPRRAQFIDNANILTIDSKESLLAEFNTLSIVYGQSSSACPRRKSKQKKVTTEPSMGESKPDEASVSVDTSLVQFDQQTTTAVQENLALKGPPITSESDISTFEENMPVEKDLVNRTTVSEEPLLPIGDKADARNSSVDSQESEVHLHSSSDNLISVDEDLKAEGMNSQRENLIPVSESLVPLEEDASLLDGNFEQGKERLGQEKNRSFSPSLVLVEQPDVTPEMFESLWRQLPETESYEVQLDSIPDQNDFLKSLSDRRIYTMASTPPGAEQIRYFLYAQADCYILCEVSLESTTMNLKSVIKMEDATNVLSFIEVFQKCLIDVTTT